jgi:multidrug efflux pump subunit AcrA (membrane-fusion protein)
VLISLVAVAVIGGVAAKLAGPQPVETVTVASAYPSQSYTLLNATGYVVPQRKASVASKGQGRLEWLGVLEGSRVKKDEVIARLENKDVRASSEQAAAQVKVAQSNLEQGMAEMNDAEANLRRSNELLAKLDAQHGNDIARQQSQPQSAAGDSFGPATQPAKWPRIRPLSAPPRRGPYQERQHRGQHHSILLGDRQ